MEPLSSWPMGSGEKLAVLGSKCPTSQECLLQLPFRRQLAILLTTEELPSIRPGEDTTKNLSWVLVGYDRVARNYSTEQFFNEGGRGDAGLERIVDRLKQSPSVFVI